MKKCNRCGNLKPPSGYYKDPRKLDNRRSICADCDNERKRKQHKKKKEELEMYRIF